LNHLAGDFLAGAVGDLLHDRLNSTCSPSRQIEPVIGLQDIGDAALADWLLARITASA
jgi:hypothetical protein